MTRAFLYGLFPLAGVIAVVLWLVTGSWWWFLLIPPALYFLRAASKQR